MHGNTQSTHLAGGYIDILMNFRSNIWFITGILGLIHVEISIYFEIIMVFDWLY